MASGQIKRFATRTEIPILAVERISSVEKLKIRQCLEFEIRAFPEWDEDH
jgi:hypothetical protein